MAFANFFDKAALGAASILQGFDRKAFESALEARTIGLCVEPSCFESFEARITLELSVNLLARLFPRIAVVTAEERQTHTLRQDLHAIAKGINPDIEILDQLPDNSICIVVGNNAVKDTENVFVGSEGWIAKVSTEGPVASGSTTNPFGAAAAACLAVANVFRLVFKAQLENSQLDKNLNFSLVDLDPLSREPINPALIPIDIGETHLVGIGAIGNGFMWVMSRLSDAKGTLHLVDHEKIGLSNLQRYILSAQSSVDKLKASTPADWQSGINIREHPCDWETYAAQHQGAGFEKVVVAVDSAEDRCAIQATLPKRILNGWTRAGNIGISRHFFLGDHACLMCLYLPEGKLEKNQDQLIAEAIRLPNRVRDVRSMLYNNTPLDENWIGQIAEALKIEPSELMRFQGHSLLEFYSEAVCGGIVFRLGAEGTVPTEVPMAFQSALAGIMLAAELYIETAGLRGAKLDSITQINMLQAMGSYLSLPAKKDPRHLCICQDEDYKKAYSLKYGVQT